MTNPARTLSDADVEAIAQRVATLLSDLKSDFVSRAIEPNAVYSPEEAARLVPISAYVIRRKLRARIIKGSGGGYGRRWMIRGSELLKLA